MIPTPTGPDGVGEAAPVSGGVPQALSLAQALGCDLGAAARLGGRHRFPLAGAHRAWLVIEGSLDLFRGEPPDCVAPPDGRPKQRPADAPSGVGRRHFVGSVPVGGLCFGFAEDCPVAVPENGTRLCPVDADALLALATHETAGRPLAEAVSAWVELLAGAAHPDLPPVTTQVLREDGSRRVQAGEIFQAARGFVFWVRGEARDVQIGTDTLAAGPTGTRIAMTDRAWLTAAADDAWDLATTRRWLTEPGAALGLRAFQDDALHRIGARVAAAVTRNRDRIRAAGDGAGRRFTGALAGLGAILQPTGRRSWGPRSTIPAIAAMQLAADYFGRRLPAHARLEPAMAARDPLLALSQRTGMAVRSVELTGDWWRDDHGVLVTTRRSDEALVLLLPGRGGTYECIDPVSGEAVRLDAAGAAGLDSRARAIYCPFPAGRLTPRAIFLFGFRGSRREGLYVLGLLIAVGVISLAVPVFTGWIIDPIIPRADTSQLLVLVIALLIAGFAQQSFSLIQSLYLLRMEGRVANTVQSAVWDRLLRLPAQFFQGFSPGDLANRAMGVDAMRQQLAGSALATATHSITGLFSLGLLFWYNWRLALTALAVVAVYCVIAYLSGRWVLRFNREQLRLSGEIQGLLLQLLSAVAKLRVGGAEHNAFARWAEVYAHQQRITYRQQLVNNRLTVFKSAFQILSILLILLVLSWLGDALLAFYHTPQNWSDIYNVKLQTLMPTAQFVPFNAALGQFIGAAFGLVGQLVSLTNIPAYYERFEPILSAAPEPVDGVDPGAVRGEIAVNAVTYRYTPEGPLVLRELTLHAAAGEFIAVVGPSGAGKSSLVRLLLGFDPPASGSVFLDGADLATLDKRLMRQNFGVVLQNGRLLAGSIYANIVAGAQLTREQAMEAARLAGFEADIAAMPMGLDTYLSEGATTLSGGQRQRLMIARAIVHRPKVLIFDEATSALDNLTQSIVTQSLATLNSTRIVIAHRLSTIVQADRIYVIDKGRVKESGTYESLMAEDGLFAAMARRQVI